MEGEIILTNCDTQTDKTVREDPTVTCQRRHRTGWGSSARLANYLAQDHDPEEKVTSGRLLKVSSAGGSCVGVPDVASPASRLFRSFIAIVLLMSSLLQSLLLLL
ncbi:hypothetical protein E2C01_023330 [Portunus trituberculatus]|uniref:Uncharacterized protein n=1 Tax=Portunus trituberculatus TaxID=210409 RepID=A0A5B7EA45_PORTR|nr:hypothetical protein [Portunus trituberculatus]